MKTNQVICIVSVLADILSSECRANLNRCDDLDGPGYPRAHQRSLCFYLHRHPGNERQSLLSRRFSALSVAEDGACHLRVARRFPVELLGDHEPARTPVPIPHPHRVQDRTRRDAENARDPDLECLEPSIRRLAHRAGKSLSEPSSAGNRWNRCNLWPAGSVDQPLELHPVASPSLESQAPDEPAESVRLPAPEPEATDGTDGTEPTAADHPSPRPETLRPDEQDAQDSNPLPARA
jgi:hypothetical protein